MELHKKQAEIINSNKRFKLLNWGRRTGKTTVLGFEILTALWNKEGLVSYYAPTHSDARDIAWSIFKEILEPITVKTNESLLEITTNNCKGTTSLLRLTGWEAVKNRDKGRGVENNLLVLDEVAFYPSFQEKYEKVLEPTLLTSKGGLIMASTPNGFNHFYQYAKKSQDSDDWLYSHATSYDNEYNDKEELDRLKREKPEDSFAQEYLADFRKLEGLVYKEFSRELHTLDIEPKTVIERFAGLDFGFTNPTALVEIHKDNDNRYWVVNEYYETGKTNSEVIEYARTLNIQTYYPDPAEPDRIEEMRRAGLHCRDVNKDVKKGIDTVRELFKSGRLFISKRCVNLIDELENYRYKDNSEEPIKEHDHLLDGLRYALFNKNGIIQGVQRLQPTRNKTINPNI